MTRRTPKPGDSYSKGKHEWRIERITRDGVVALSFYAGEFRCSFYSTYEQFHTFMALQTWGRE
jgi:hypothetical protein